VIAFHELEDVAFGVLEETDAEAGDVLGGVDDVADLDAVGLEAFDDRFQLGDVEGEMLESDGLFASLVFGRELGLVRGEHLKPHCTELEHEELIRLTGIEGTGTLEPEMLGVEGFLGGEVSAGKGDVIKGVHFLFRI